MSEWRSQKIDLIRDLRFLRKDRGLTPDRMFVATTLEEVCGGNVQPVEVTRDRLISAIRSLPGQMSEALLAAYGLLPETEGLTTLNGRRRAYGVRVGRKSDTLADREDTAIEELALRLLNSYWAGAPLPPELPPLPHGGGFLIELLNVTTVYRDRFFTEHQQQRRVISLVEGAKGFRYHCSDTDSSGRTQLIAVDGCTAHPPEYVAGGSLHTLRFPEPLHYGQPHEFTFREVLGEPESQKMPEDDFAGQSFETPALKYVQEVVFFGERPPIIWGYDKLSRVERPGSPERNELLKFGDGNTLRKEFYQQYGGLFSGIAWQW